MKLFALLALGVPLCALASEELQFEPNRGQTAGDVRYLARTRNALISLTDAEIVIYHSPENSSSQTIRLGFIGSNRRAIWQPVEPGAGTTSYIIGNDSRAWIRDIPHVNRVARKEIYPGTDLVVYGSKGRLEYDFVLSPGADPGRIELNFTGAGDLELDPEGNLVLPLLSGAVIQKKPVLYQTDASGAVRSVEGSFRLVGRDRAGFTVGAYDPRYPLTIDPVLESATWIGGAGADRVFGADPRAAVVGSTASADFPGVPAGLHRRSDIFVHFPESQLTVVIGGSGDDVVTSVSMLPGGGSFTNLAIGGYTNSRDFPVATGPLAPRGYVTAQENYGGGDWDGFVLLLAPGSGTPYISTYLGGSGDDRVLSVSQSGSFGFLSAAGSTNSTDFPLANAWQSSPGGGVDGFVSVLGSEGRLWLSSYLGGSGDDRALAVILQGTASDLYVGGETRSGDWTPPWNGVRRGASDGFVIHFKGNALAFGSYFFSEAALIGGPDEDRVTALTTMTSGRVAAAGVTSAPDFSAPRPAAAGPGGGSDIFVAQFPADLRTFQITAVIGGSGADEATSIDTNIFSELLVGGWTNSTDFPVADPLQPAYGGGPEDGFAVHLDAQGQRILSTYYGGSGADRVTSVRFGDSQLAFMGGVSDSPALLLKDAVQEDNAGSTDGFFVAWSSPAIYADGLTAGKDLAGTGYARLGDSRNFIGVPLTVTSSDPSKVLIATRPDDPGQPSAVISNRATDGDLPGRSFRVYCLTGSGVIPVSLSAPGYASRTIEVRCVPSGLAFSPKEVLPPQSNIVTVFPVAVDPDTGQAIPQNPRGGLDPIHISATVSNPFQLSRSSIDIDPYSTLVSPSGSYNAAGIISVTSPDNAAGSGEILFQTDSRFAFIAGNRVPVRATVGTMSLFVPVLARDFLGRLGLSISSNTAVRGVPVTYTSSDPSKARLTIDPLRPGLESVTVAYDSFPSTAPYVEILDSDGPVSITATAPGFEPVTQPVRFGEPQLRFFDRNGQPVTKLNVTVGDADELRILVAFTSQSLQFTAPVKLRPGFPGLRLSLVNSDPKAATPSRATYIWNPGSDFASSLAFSAISQGTAVFSVDPETAGPVSARSTPLTINVAPVEVFMPPSISVGKDLQSSLFLYLTGPQPRSAPITLTSSDPSRLLLSSDVQTLGQARLTISQTNRAIVQSLADSGSVDVTATAPGYTSGKTTVKLTPSGFAWTRETTRIGAGFNSSPPGIVAYALDSENLAPFESQLLRPGVSGSLLLQNSNPEVVQPEPSEFPLSALDSGNPSGVPGFVIKFNPVGRGTARIAVAQPAGFIQPVGRGPLRLRSSGAAPLVLYPPVLGRNLQVDVSVSTNANEPITFTSGDPSRLVFSTSESELGAGAITIRRRATGEFPRLILQAVDGPGDVKITATAADLEESSFIVQIHPSAFAFLTGGGPDQVVRTNTQQSSLSWTLASVPVPSSGPAEPTNLRAGLDPISLQISSSNPAVATVQREPILMNGLTSRTVFQINPLAPGETQITIGTPPGFVLAPPGRGGARKLVVDGPAFSIADLVLGKDLQAQVRLEVLSGSSTPPADVDVLLTSGDPSKVLLSADATAVGSGSLNVHLAAGQSINSRIFVQGLTAAGEVPIQISAAGYRTTTMKVTLVLTILRNNGPRLLSLQPPSRVLTLTPAPADGFTPFGYQLRAGLVDAVATVSTSDPNVVRLPSSRLNLTAGASQLELPIQLAGPGAVKLNFSLPGTLADTSIVELTVEGGRLSLDRSFQQIGKNLQDSFVVSGENFSQVPVLVTVTSPDPTRLLVSESASSAGQLAISVASQPGRELRVYLHALADNGTVPVRVSAPGYQDTSAQVNLFPAAVYLVAPQLGTLTPLSAPLTFEARLSAYVSGGSAGTAQALRPGAPAVSTQVSLSDPKIGSFTPAQLVFNPGESRKTFAFQPVAEGVGLLSLSVPAGLADPLSGRQQLLSIIGARLGFNGTLTVGKDLVKSFAVRLPAPSRPLSVTLTSADPARLLISDSSHPNGAASVTISVAAGADTSSSFALIGLASSGTVALNATSTSLPAASYEVTLQPSGFRFNNSSTFFFAGSTNSVPIVVSALDPQTLAPEGSYTLRPGAAAASLAVTTNNPAVLTVLGSPVTFFAGDSQRFVSVSPRSAGSATLTLEAPPGFSTPSSGASVTFSIRQ